MKIPRWPFDKFAFGDRQLGTQMKATGEVMAIDRDFEAALQKAVRSLEVGSRSLLWESPRAGGAQMQDGIEVRRRSPSTYAYPLDANDERLWALMAALRRGGEPMELAHRTGIDPWFLRQDGEHRRHGEAAAVRALHARPAARRQADRLLRRADRRPRRPAARAGAVPAQAVGHRPVYKMVDTCAAEFDAATPYFYSTYEQENEALPEPVKKALVIGSGPIRIGQGIEFDYCSVHSVWALQEAGYKAFMANSNPETVSTDFDTSDRLYFEPLDEEERARHPGERERGDGLAAAVHRPVRRADGDQPGRAAAPATTPILGSSAEAIDLAEDRRRFEAFLSGLGIPQPPGAGVTTLEDALNIAEVIGYPVLVRPSYVLGGRAMEIVQNATELVRFMGAAVELSGGKPILIDKYFEGKEVEVDAIGDGEQRAHPRHHGAHRARRRPLRRLHGRLPRPQPEPSRRSTTIVDYTQRIGLALNVRGLMNIQFVIMPDELGGRLHRLRARGEPARQPHRALPLQGDGVPMVQLAVNVMLGKTLAEQGYSGGLWPRAEPGRDQGAGLLDVQADRRRHLPRPGDEVDGRGHGHRPHVPGGAGQGAAGRRADAPPAAAASSSASPTRTSRRRCPSSASSRRPSFRLYATEGTADMIRGLGMPVEQVTKRISEGHPNVVDVIQEGMVDCVVNTPEGGGPTAMRDGFQIRRAAAERPHPLLHVAGHGAGDGRGTAARQADLQRAAAPSVPSQS